MHGGGEPSIGHHQRSLCRHKSCQAADGVLQERVCAGQGQELLGKGGSTGGPEAGAGATGHDNGMQHGERFPW